MPRLRHLLALLAIGCASPALACDCVRLDPAFPHFEEELDRIAAFYPVAAEGVVEAAGPYAWRFRPTHEYRGAGKPSYRLELLSDCSLDPIEMKKMIGKRVFLLLSRGTGGDSYEAQRCVNLQAAPVEAAIRARVEASCTSR